MTVVSNDITNLLRAHSNIESVTIVVDNAVPPLRSCSFESTTIDALPPLRQLRKIDLRRLNTARKVRKQFEFLQQQQQYSHHHLENEVDELFREFRKLSMPLSPPSRWESIPKEGYVKKDHTPKMAGTYGKDTFSSLPVTAAWRVNSPVSIMNLQSASANAAFSPGRMSIFMMDGGKGPTIRALPGRKLSNSPVRMPVRKNSVDCQPRKPVRSSASARNATLSILDEALSVCDMYGDELNDPEVMQVDETIESVTRSMMPSFPSLTSC